MRACVRHTRVYIKQRANLLLFFDMCKKNRSYLRFLFIGALHLLEVYRFAVYKPAAGQYTSNLHKQQRRSVCLLTGPLRSQPLIRILSSSMPTSQRTACSNRRVRMVKVSLDKTCITEAHWKHIGSTMEAYPMLN